MEIKDFKKGDKVIYVVTSRESDEPIFREMLVVSVGKKYLKCCFIDDKFNDVYRFEKDYSKLGAYFFRGVDRCCGLLFKNKWYYNEYVEFIELQKWFRTLCNHYAYYTFTKKQLLAIKEILENKDGSN